MCMCVCSDLSTYTHRPWGVRLGNSVNSISERLSLGTRSVDEKASRRPTAASKKESAHRQRSLLVGWLPLGPCLPITAAFSSWLRGFKHLPSD